ncbi:hypothetical protein [Sphingobium sp. CR28]|uniref:hypothetical protein n=1 Tax=Sphingobium sp. CR28 TaxID=3400272 RepID=UPI003FEE3488
MTLEQVFPGLQGKPSGAIIALADSFLDITGPSRALTSELTSDWTGRLIDEITALNPAYRFGSFGIPETPQGQINQVNELRFVRAITSARIKGEIRPLQVETLRFIQESTDAAYEQGVKLLRQGKLNIRLSDAEALGNFLDREVRMELRRRYNRYGIDSAGKGPVRVNRRENNSSELTFRRPDARVGNIAYDVTLSQKTLRTHQIRGFFAADFRPSHVIIIRPTQLGSNSTYIISRPETK